MMNIRQITAVAVCLLASAMGLSAAQSQPMRVGGEVRAPVKVSDVAPVYPPDAQRAGIQGAVILEATITAAGAVTEIRVLRSIPELDAAAVAAVRQWTYQPATLNGNAVPVIMSVVVNFTLAAGAGGPSPAPSAGRGTPRPTTPAPPSTGSAPAAIFPACSGSSYAVSNLRWETFPIAVYIEAAELTRRGFSAERRAEIQGLLMEGLGSWARATDGAVGSVIQVSNASDAQLNVVFRNGTGNTIHDSVTNGFIRHATILADISSLESFGPPATRTVEGLTWVDGSDHRLLNFAAHEMGHVLGIVGHPVPGGSLMASSSDQVQYRAPQPIDATSILKKYQHCREGA